MSNFRNIALATCTAALMMTAAPALAGSMVIEKAWAEEYGEDGGDMFAIVKNTGDSADTLYAVKTKIAKQSKLEALSEEEVEEGKNETVLSFVIQPGETFEMTEEGPHVEMRGMRRELKEGMKFKATFYFEKAGPVFTEVTVEEE